MDKLGEGFLKLFVNAMDDHSFVRGLKELASRVGDYDLANMVREHEEKIAINIDKTSPDYIAADRLHRALKICNVNTTVKVAFMINEMTKMLEENPDSLDLKRASGLLAKATELFG